jgi:hypothetical protein
MLKFEAVRHDPSPGEIVELLTEATATANKRCRARLLEDDPAKWRKGANLCQASAEGWEMWRGGRGAVPATQVMLSWWTDPIGRKHVVVRGRRCEFDGAKVYLDRRLLEVRPALWHCYPARIFLKRTASAKEWIAVCGCGAAGSPSSLGWMGDTCGPCHDARAEHGESAIRDHRIGILSGPRATPTRVAIRPDGSAVAMSDASGKFHLWTLGDESRHEFKAEVRLIDMNHYARPNLGSCLAFTGDGRTLVNDYFVRDEQILGLDTATDPPMLIPLTPPAHAPNVVIPWAENTFCRVWSDQLEWVDAATREPVRSLKVPLGNVWQAIPSHDYSRLFVRVGNRCTVIDPDDGQILVRPELADPEGMLYREEVEVHCAFSADFKRIVVGYHMQLFLLDGLTGRVIVRKIDQAYPFDRSQLPEDVKGVSLDATGQFVVVGGSTRVAIYRLTDFMPVATIHWHLNGIRAYAATPDGKHFVTAGFDGQVKYWPIDRMIGLSS